MNYFVTKADLDPSPSALIPALDLAFQDLHGHLEGRVRGLFVQVVGAPQGAVDDAACLLFGQHLFLGQNGEKFRGQRPACHAKRVENACGNLGLNFSLPLTHRLGPNLAIGLSTDRQGLRRQLGGARLKRRRCRIFNSVRRGIVVPRRERNREFGLDYLSSLFDHVCCQATRDRSNMLPSHSVFLLYENHRPPACSNSTQDGEGHAQEVGYFTQGEVCVRTG
jgi:hypothetical protein